MKYAYMVTAIVNGELRAVINFNKRNACITAKSCKGEVYRMDYGMYKDGAKCAYGWDSPTFRMFSEKIYPA